MSFLRRFFKKPTHVEFCSGVGTPLGFEMAGYDNRLSIDLDSNVEETFRKNFPDSPFERWDLSEITAEQVLGRAGLNVGELDIAGASIPCQPLSIAGPQRLDDERLELFFNFIDLVENMQSHVVVMENVDAIFQKKFRPLLNKINNGLIKANYNVVCGVLNAAHFSVPQNRKRAFWIAVRKDHSHIRPTLPKPGKRIITVREALGDHIDAFTPNQFDWKPIPSDRSVCTITKTNSLRLFEAGEMREPEIDELKKLSSFPLSFQFSGEKKNAWDRMGNCVPPLMAKAVAMHIRKTILNKTK